MLPAGVVRENAAPDAVALKSSTAVTFPWRFVKWAMVMSGMPVPPRLPGCRGCRGTSGEEVYVLGGLRTR